MNLKSIYKQGRLLLGAFCAISLISGAGFAAAARNGCDSDTNDHINPAIALCSAHTYNIGLPTNPDNASERQLMNDVVALKSTIVTQQMKKQYDYLEVTIRRFKTQLEKALLTAQMEAAGATPESGGASGGSSMKSSDKNVILAGTENCNNKSSRAEVYTCLRQNYNLIYNMSSGGQTISIEVRKQLASDYAIAVGNLPNDSKGNKISAYDVGNIKCDQYQSLSGRETVQTCLNALNANIRNASDTIEQNSRSQRQQF